MKPNLNDLIGKSVNLKNEITDDVSLAKRLILNADKAMGVNNVVLKKQSEVKNLTFTFGVDEVDNIQNEVDRFLSKGINVSKSELMRIGLKLIQNTDEADLYQLSKLIVRHPRGRK